MQNILKYFSQTRTRGTKHHFCTNNINFKGFDAKIFIDEANSECVTLHLNTALLILQTLVRVVIINDKYN